MERRPPRQLTAREDVTVEVELRKELGEGGVAVLSPLGGPAAPAEQVPAELLALDRAVAVRVDHVEELVCPRVGRLVCVDPLHLIADKLRELAEQRREGPVPGSSRVISDRLRQLAGQRREGTWR